MKLSIVVVFRERCAHTCARQATMVVMHVMNRSKGSYPLHLKVSIEWSAVLDRRVHL